MSSLLERVIQWADREAHPAPDAAKFLGCDLSSWFDSKCGRLRVDAGRAKARTVSKTLSGPGSIVLK
jgi:hypothetical protein